MFVSLIVVEWRFVGVLCLFRLPLNQSFVLTFDFVPFISRFHPPLLLVFLIGSVQAALLQFGVFADDFPLFLRILWHFQLVCIVYSLFPLII